MSQKTNQNLLTNTLRVLKSFVCDAAITLTGAINSDSNITTTGNMETEDLTVNGVANADTIRDDGYKAITGGNADVSNADKSRVVREATFTFDDNVDVAIPQANPYGNVKLGDLPATNVIILGAIIDIAVTGSNLTPDADLSLALGTVATASADFSNAGEDNLIEGVAPSSGDVKSASGTDGGISNVLVPAGTAGLYLNIGANPAPTGGGTATVTTGGTIRVFYIDLENHS